ncbi:cellulose binding domain-containing protein [Streptomyces sp. NPDC091412]|uniref:GH12 family glycosyl hydrolase domain-containing protein n=1 Tax=Streptomyces sp. NPDC091412 TaxID=3366002 RepID=UPI003829C400
MRLLPHRLDPARGLLCALLTALALVAAFLAAAPAARADTQICDAFGTTTIQGRYVVQNNRWGTDATQCITVTDSGFRINRADGSAATNGAPKSYPSVYNGCHYTNCSPGTALPARLDTISSAPTSISYGYVSDAVYDAAYDIWLDPTARKDGVNRTEIMVWFNKVGPIQPVGSQTGTATVAGRSWQVWSGSNGSNNVLSFVAPSAITSWNFDVMDFVQQAVSRQLASSNWYLTSVQAGFEPWQNGTGLAVTSFSSEIRTGGNGGGGNGGGGGGNPGGQTACSVTYATNVWPGGFTADVTVRNTGSTAVNGWQLGFTLPSGQRVTSAWNATVNPASGVVTASALSHNAQLAPGGSQTFGFQGTYSGTFAAPNAFTLNGTACNTA